VPRNCAPARLPLLLNSGQRRLLQDEVDLEDVDAYFWHIFSRLRGGDDLSVGELFLFRDYISGRQIWATSGCHPAARTRRALVRVFGIRRVSQRLRELPQPLEILHRRDGLVIKQGADAFTWIVTYNKRSVTFHLHKLRQDPPKSFSLRSNETFIERTFDESGIQFFLLFNTSSNYFFWVLNEEEKVPDEFTALDKKRSSAGAQDSPSGLMARNRRARYWLASQDQRHAQRLLRRPVRSTGRQLRGPNKNLLLMERAIPSIKGRIDKWGYYTDVERPHAWRSPVTARTTPGDISILSSVPRRRSPSVLGEEELWDFNQIKLPWTACKCSLGYYHFQQQRNGKYRGFTTGQANQTPPREGRWPWQGRHSKYSRGPNSAPFEHQ